MRENKNTTVHLLGARNTALFEILVGSSFAFTIVSFYRRASTSKSSTNPTEPERRLDSVSDITANTETTSPGTAQLLTTSALVIAGWNIPWTRKGHFARGGLLLLIRTSSMNQNSE